MIGNRPAYDFARVGVEHESEIALERAVGYALSEAQSITPSSHAPDQPFDDEQPPSLTRREEEVAALVARGLTNRQIATELSISEHTVANHVARILRKLEVGSRSQLTAWVVERQTPP